MDYCAEYPGNRVIVFNKEKKSTFTVFGLGHGYLMRILLYTLLDRTEQNHGTYECIFRIATASYAPGGGSTLHWLLYVTRGIDETREMKYGTVAVGIIIATILFAIIPVIQSGIAGISIGIMNVLTAGLAFPCCFTHSAHVWHHPCH